jgi:hypothetical protein
MVPTSMIPRGCSAAAISGCLTASARQSRTDAREQLSLALQTFEQLAADPWGERARRELRAAGIKPHDPSATPPPTLSPRKSFASR